MKETVLKRNDFMLPLPHGSYYNVTKLGSTRRYYCSIANYKQYIAQHYIIQW